jgi:hypothetical protein
MKTAMKFRSHSRNLPGLLIALAAFYFTVLPKTQAISPAPDGGYPGGNTAEGQNALFSLTTGAANTAVGWFSLWGNGEGSFNTATGAGALLFNAGDENTAFGAAALLFNTTGFSNTAVGAATLLNNTTGVENTAIGGGALSANTEGLDNAATGFGSLSHNTTGTSNTADGSGALFINTTGEFNTAVGQGALQANITGSANVALGVGAGGSVTTADNVICIGATVAGANVSNRCYIGNIRSVTTGNSNAIPVLIDTAGQLGTVSSSRRYKKEIKPMDNASEVILALNPVTFHYKSDNTNRPEFGLIAEQVAKVNPDLVVRDENGEIYTVRYDAVNAMLLNEFLKEHRKVEELTKDFQVTVAQLTARLDEQAAQIQKVNAQLEARKPAPQVVNNP